jgi:hypothetical protein
MHTHIDKLLGLKMFVLKKKNAFKICLHWKVVSTKKVDCIKKMMTFAKSFELKIYLYEKSAYIKIIFLHKILLCVKNGKLMYKNFPLF